MRLTMEGLLKRVSEFSGRLVALESSEACADGTLVRSSVLIHGLTSELNQQKLQYNRILEELHDRESQLRLQSRKIAKATMLREQIAIEVTNSICSGYINIQIGTDNGAVSIERRFACLTCADLRVYDYTLSALTTRLLLSEHRMEVFKKPSEVEYILRHKSNARFVTIIVPEDSIAFSKWSSSLDMMRNSSTNLQNELGPAVSVPYPVVTMGTSEDGSTIVDLSGEC